MKRKHESGDAVDESDKRPRTGARTQDTSKTTLSISSLPAEFSTSDLSSLFATVAPLKSAFVVKDKSYGYVVYQNAKDAESALSKFGPSHALDSGHAIHVKWANRRHRSDAATNTTSERPAWAERKQAQKERAAAVQSQPADAAFDAKRTVFVRLYGTVEITGEDLKKGLYKKAKKLLAVMPNVPQDAELKVDLAQDTSEAYILAPTPRLAAHLNTKLNSHIFKSKLLITCLKHEYDFLIRRGKSVGARLVLRNLHFNVSAFDLYAAFCPFGSIHSIETPKDKNGKGRGFAFVWFVQRKAAEAAIKKVNGKELYPGMGVEKIKEGGEGKKQTRQRLKTEGEDLKKDKRQVAVDWALGKDQFEKAQAGEVSVQADESIGIAEHASEEDLSTADSDSDADQKADQSESEQSELEQEDSQESEEENSEEDFSPVEEGFEAEEEESDEEIQPAQKSNVGTTLFVRNIQFEATEDELYNLFKEFGPTRYARIVVDQQTGRSRGTGFVNFYRDDDAQKVIKLSDTLLARGGTNQTVNPFGQNSVLVLDPSSSSASALSLHGRVLAVSQAVSKDDAEALREDRDKKSGTKDRRNLYLSKEGAIDSDSIEAKYLTTADLDARSSSYSARKALLRTNPSLYVSRTRLSIRQIPLFVTDSVLKKLALHAVKTFDVEVKSAGRKPLSTEELSEEGYDAEGKPFKLGQKEVKAPKLKNGKIIPPSRVVQSKILRQNDKVDPISGLGRSKGYGFLEMDNHANALKALRWINANADVGKVLQTWHVEELAKEVQRMTKIEGPSDQEKGRMERMRAKLDESKGNDKKIEGRLSRTLIVEFSIENATTVKRRNDRAEKSRQKAQEANLKRKAEEELELVKAKDQAKQKKRKTAISSVSDLSEKQFGGVNSLIGKKRKERKAKRGAK